MSRLIKIIRSDPKDALFTLALCAGFIVNAWCFAIIFTGANNV